MTIVSIIEDADKRWPQVVAEIMSLSKSSKLKPNTLQISRFFSRKNKYVAVLYVSLQPKSNKKVAKAAELEYYCD